MFAYQPERSKDGDESKRSRDDPADLHNISIVSTPKVAWVQISALHKHT